VRRHAIQIKRDGRVWSGAWLVEEDKLFMISAYGVRSVLAGAAATRAAQAEALLAEIVDDFVTP
jgi:hypothetical protein